MQENEVHPDVIVVGSGPGGAAVARDLTRRGKRVLILERGPGGPIRGTFGQYLRELLAPGKSLLVTPDILGMVRGITTGGSSLFFYATCFPAPLGMLRNHGVELASEVEEVRRELPVGPLRDEMMTPMASRLQQAAGELGLAWKRLDKFMHQDRWRPGLPFGYYGDRHGVKWSARDWVEEAVAGGAVLWNGARVTRVLLQGGQAAGVELVRGGRTTAVSAPVVVVAAGGIGSPLILRASGLAEAGRDFFFDPLVTVCGTIKDVALRPDEIPMSAGIHMEDEGILMSDMPIPFENHLIFTAQALRMHKLLAFRSTARIMIKIRDALTGRLTDGGGVRKRLTAEDRDKLRHGVENARRILSRAGASGIYRTCCMASHPGGTVKIGHLVDADLQTPFRNVYVCDCSVIPEPLGLPPTLTILALGKRLARRLAGADAARSVA